MLIELLPSALPRTQVGTFDLAIAIRAVPATGGEHTLGIGFGGSNGGVVFNGGPTAQFHATFTVHNLAVSALNIVPEIIFAGGCQRSFSLGIGLPENPAVSVGSPAKALLFSIGSSFSDQDLFYARANGTGLDGSDLQVDFSVCNQLMIGVSLPTQLKATRGVMLGGWEFSVLDAPNWLSIHQADAFGWQGGYKLEFGDPTSGVLTGSVKKGSATLPIEVTLSDARAIAAAWSSSSPWLLLGAGGDAPGDFIRFRVFGEVDVTAREEWDGMLFDNDWAIDHRVRGSECQNAYFGAVKECRLPS